LVAVQVFPVPLTLLVMGAFYLWIYARSGKHPVEQGKECAAGGD
jgi:hypothetical protein